MLNLVEDFKCHLKGLCNKNLVPNVDLLGSGVFLKKLFIVVVCICVCLCEYVLCVQVSVETRSG